MRIIHILGIAIFFISQLVFAADATKLALELDYLYKKTALNDPNKIHLALRLADVLFDASLEINKTKDFSKKNLASYEQYRLRSISLYESVLNGLGGRFTRPKGQKRVRIQFQLARLYNDQGWLQKSENLWKYLSEQNLVAEIQTEASLRLAERYELSNSVALLSKARDLYTKVLSRPGKSELKSYVYYRRAWVFHRIGQSNQGLHDLLVALDKSDRASEDEILKDITLFLAHAGNSFDSDYRLTEKLNDKYRKTGLWHQLAVSYKTADEVNKYATLLGILNKQNPSVENYVALMELAYNEKNVRKLRDLSTGLYKLSRRKQTYSDEEAQKKAEETLFHLVVQWDGETKTNSSYRALFLESAISFLQLFVTSENYLKVADGWLATIDKEENRFAQLSDWIDTQHENKNLPYEIELRKRRAALAKLLGEKSTEQEDYQFIANNIKNDEEKRDYNYALSRTLIAKGPSTEGEHILKGIALGGRTDDKSVYSAHLLLDQLSKQRRYSDMIAFSSTWLKKSVPAGFRHAHRKDYQEIEKIKEQAEFELASEHKNKKSLITFEKFCLQKKFLPTSCDNAKTLSIQLKDQDKLISLLKRTNDREALTTELEFAGRFSEASKLLEKQSKRPPLSLSLKTALFYEIDGKFNDRNRVLRAASSQLQANASGAEKAALYAALKDANLLEARLLSAAWLTGEYQVRLAEDLEVRNRGNYKTKQLLLAECAYMGPAWQKVQRLQLEKLFQQQKQMTFIGRNSEARFNRKVAAIKTFNDKSQCYLSGATAMERYVVMYKLFQAYGEMSLQILSTPIPKGLDQETLAAVENQLKEMSSPFTEQSAAWKKAADKERASIIASNRDMEKLTRINWPKLPSIQSPKRQREVATWRSGVEALKKDPYSKRAVESLYNKLDDLGEDRMALYFKGRMDASSERRSM